MFTVKMSEGVVATSYSKGDKFFIDPQKLLPLERFLPRPKGAATPGRGGAAHAAVRPLAGALCPAAGGLSKGMRVLRLHIQWCASSPGLACSKV